jgi:signal transduction histidine kinase
LNLLINAIESMSARQDGPRQMSIGSAAGPTRDVIVRVCDTGSGVEPAKVERLFDAFYTTKSDGMGLGLTISRSIIEAHGGRLWAEAASPSGAIFQFSIPGERRKAA